MVNLTVACCHTSLPQRKKKKEKKEEMKSRRKKKMKHDTVPMLWKICGPLTTDERRQHDNWKYFVRQFACMQACLGVA